MAIIRIIQSLPDYLLDEARNEPASAHARSDWRANPDPGRLDQRRVLEQLRGRRLSSESRGLIHVLGCGYTLPRRLVASRNVPNFIRNIH